MLLINQHFGGTYSIIGTIDCLIIYSTQTITISISSEFDIKSIGNAYKCNQFRSLIKIHHLGCNCVASIDHNNKEEDHLQILKDSWTQR